MNTAVITPPSSVLTRWTPWLPGVALCAAVAAVAMQLGQTAWAQSHGATALTLAIVIGMLLGNTIYPHLGPACGPGVNFSKAKLLRLGVVLYGWRLTVQDIGHVGVAGVVIDALVLCSTLGWAYLAGTRWLRMDRETAMLIGTGSAICGAAAVMAAAPVVRARSEQVTVAIATVVVFGTLSIFLYPVLYNLNQAWHLIPGGAEGFGIYAGSTIHEVAQVVAAARSISPAAADTAVIAKMVRVMMLAPALIALSSLLMRRHAAPANESKPNPTVVVPWFAFAFIGVVLLNSLHWLPQHAIAVVNDFDTGLLAMAMAALGLSTHVSAIRQAGLRPLLLAAALFIWLVAGGALINRSVSMLLG